MMVTKLVLLVATAAASPPPTLPPLALSPDDQEHELHLLPIDLPAARACGPAGTVCFSAARGSTVTSADEAPEGPDGAVRVTLLSRAAQVAATARTPLGDEAAPWDVKLVAHLKRKTVKGAILILAYDRADPEGMARREVTGLWSVDTSSSGALALQLRLSPDAGFRAGHTYLIRIVQVLGRREIVLAEGDVQLY